MIVDLDLALADAYRRRGWWRDEVLTDDLDRHVDSEPDKAAIVAHRADALRPEVVTYRQLGRLTDRIAVTLLDLGVRPGRVVSFQLPNWWQFTALALACVRTGAVANPILPILRRREVSYILEQVEPALLVVPDEFRGFAHGLMAMEAATTSGLEPARVCVIGRRIPQGATSFDESFVVARREREGGGDRLHELRPDADRLAAIQFTSGTTGAPKGVMHTHNTLYAATHAMATTYGLGREDVVLMPSAMAHATGYLHGTMMPIIHGMKVVYQDVWEPTTFLRLVEEERVTWTMGATPFVTDATDAAARQPHDLSSLQTFVSAGAPIPPALIEQVSDRLDTELHAVWGMTENGAVTFTRPGDTPARRASSDGRPWDGMQLRIVDQGGSEVPTGAIGRLLARGAAQFVGYFARPDLSAEAVDEEGWFDTGDLARVDEDGYIRISGRSKDLVIRGGENVPVIEIEGLLFAHPSIDSVVLVGYPDERLGERVCAVVVPAGNPPSLDDLTEFLREQGVAKHFWPERLEVVDDLPRTASGKIQKFLVRQRITDDNDPTGQDV